MAWLRIWRWLVGYVWFSGEGGFPERLISDAAAAGISLSDSRRRQETLIACCPARDYRRLRPLARRACMRLRVRRKSGLYFRLFPYRKRIGLPVGLLLATLLLFTLSQRIWIVQAEGNTAVSDGDILSAMETLGVYPGCRIRSLDMEWLRVQALTALPQLSYISVNPSGCVARIAVTERDPTPSIQDFTRNYSNLVAARDGRILSIEVYSGQTAVTVGQGVTGGMLLVGGAVESASGNTVFRRSAGRILAETTRTLTVTVPLEETLLLPDGQTVFRPMCRFLAWDIPLFGSSALTDSYAVTEYQHLPKNGELTLPIGFIHRYYAHLSPTHVLRTADEASLLAEERLQQQKEALSLTGVTLLGESERRVEKTDAALTVTVVCRCEEDIAREVPLAVSPDF